MNKLKQVYELRGMGYSPMPTATLLERNEKAAIYERNNHDGTIYYEVFKVRLKPERELPNGVLDTQEMLGKNMMN